MNNEITNALTRKLASSIAKEIDIEAMAKRLAPKIAREIETKLLEGFVKLEWTEIAQDMLANQKVWKATQEFLAEAVVSKLKGPG